MFSYMRKAGTTDVSVVIRIIDSTDGTPETGVAYNTSGIDLEYRREGAASTDITEASLSALTDAHSDGGFLHIGNGYYRLDLPDAACAAGVPGVLVHGTVTGMVVIGCYVQLVTFDPFDSVRLGLTALPNAAADAAGGLPISDAGGLDIDAKLANTNEVTAARMGALTDLIDGGRLDLLIDQLVTYTDILDNATSGNAKIASDVATTLSRIIGTLASGTHNPQGGDAYARLGAPAGASVSADIAAVKGDSAAILTDTGTTLDGKIDTIDGIVDTIVARVIGTIAAGTHNPQSGDAYARLGAPAGASIAADIAAVPTADELTAGLAALNDITVAEVWAQIIDGTVTALVAMKHQLAAANGNMEKGESNDYAVKDRAGNTLYTITFTETERTRS